MHAPVTFYSEKKKSHTAERVQTAWFAFCAFIIVFFFLFIVARIVWQGAPVVFQKDFPFVNTSFFSERPQILMTFQDESFQQHRMSIADYRKFEIDNPDTLILGLESHNYSAGGVFSPLIGTILIVGICIVLAMFVGIAAAIYLSEYSRKGRLISLIRLAILNLAGVPSIVYGLFGFAFFCYAFPVITKDPIADRALKLPFMKNPLLFSIGEKHYLSFQGWEPCMLAAGCTLAVMILPVIITACEESLRAVPRGLREASLALGATKWQTVRKSVLPFALPGILTASVLGVTRVAGETAPIMYTGAFASGDLPWVGLQKEGIAKVGEFFLRGVEAMPYHIYTVSSKIPQEDAVKPMQYGAVLVFMVIVMALAALSVACRMYFSRKLKW